MGHHTPERFDSLSFMMRFLLRFWKAAWAQFLLVCNNFLFHWVQSERNSQGLKFLSRVSQLVYYISVAGNWLC